MPEKKKILIVDDVQLNISILAELLKDKYNTCYALNGIDALEVVASQAIDMVLLDLEMPGMDGLEVCAKLKADPEKCEIPIIFVTGADDVKKKAKAMDLGAADYLPKPVDPPIIKRQIQEIFFQEQQRKMIIS